MPETPLRHSIRVLGRHIRTGRLTIPELVAEVLESAQRLNDELNLYITIAADHAMARAEQLQNELDQGRDRGALHGMPYGVKDHILTKGVPTTFGSDFFQDADGTCGEPVARRLDDAGAILIGKSNLLTSFGTWQDRPAKNPWSPEHSPGWSSSGAGAAVAARLTRFEIGSDAGGSVREPAALCGVCGLKPTFGRVPRGGWTTAIGWDTVATYGPIGTSADDLAPVMNVIAGHDPSDINSTRAPVPDYGTALQQNICGLRVGVPNQFFYEDVDSQIASAVDEALRVLAQNGATISGVDLPLARHAPEVKDTVDAERAYTLERWAGKEILESDRASHLPDAIRARLASMADGEFPAEPTAYAYLRAQRQRMAIIAELAGAFDVVDVLAVPSTKIFAPRNLGQSDYGPLFHNSAYGNLTGVPGMAIPCGLSTGDPTLPMSIQFYAPPLGEATLLRTAHAYQRETDWHQKLPPLSAIWRRSTP